MNATLVNAYDSSGRARLVSPWASTDVTSMTLVASLDSGNVNPALSTVSLANTSEPVVYLDVRSAVGPWWNMVFTLANAQGKRPIFRVNRNTNISPSITPPASWLAAYSYDTRSYTNWTRASSRANVGGTTGYWEWQFDEAFVSDGPIIATSPLGRTQDVDFFVQQQLLTNSACAPAPCASTNGVFNVTPSENDEFGGPIGQKPMYALLYDWGGASNDGYPKRVATVLTHIHAQGEATNWQSFRYWFDWLHGDDPKAVALRANWKFLLYTPAMPNGLFGGDRRGVIRNSFDPNRVWNVSSFQEIDAIKAAIVNDVGSLGLGYHAMLSWHGGYTTTNPARAYVVPADTSAGTRSRFTTAMGTAVGSYLAQSFDYDSSGTFNTAVWWAQTQGVHFRFDIETPVTGSTALSQYQSIGEAWGKAMADMDAQGRFIPGVPDFSVDASDGVQFLDPSIRDEQHQLGDGTLIDDYPLKDLAKQVLSSMVLYDLRQNDLSKNINLGVLLSDELTIERFLQFLESMLLGDLATTEVGSARTVSAQDGLMLVDNRTFELLLVRLSGLFLGSLGSTDVTSPPPAGVQLVLHQDGLMLEDYRLTDRALAIMVKLLLGDSPILENLKGMLDSVIFADERYRGIDLNATDTAYLEDRVLSLREILWNEGLYFSEATERSVVGVIIAHLVYARLTINAFLGTRLTTRDYLGRQVGATNWRLN